MYEGHVEMYVGTRQPLAQSYCLKKSYPILGTAPPPIPHTLLFCLICHKWGLYCLSPFSRSTKMCPVLTIFNRLSPTYSYVDLHIKMSASCTFFVLLASYRLHMVVQTLLSTRVILPTASHSVTQPIHEYHVNIPWISVPLRRFRSTRGVEEY